MFPNQPTNLFAQLAAQQRAAAAYPISYIPTSAITFIRSTPVHSMHALCHPVTPLSGNGTTNHWTLSFSTSSAYSVNLNIQPDPQQPHESGGSKASVIISLIENEGGAGEVVRAEKVEVVNKGEGEGVKTVGWYVDFLERRGRFQYVFTKEGVGCRAWVRDVLGLLVEEGEVDKDGAEAARGVVGFIWPEGRYEEPSAGTYF